MIQPMNGVGCGRVLWAGVGFGGVGHEIHIMVGWGAMVWSRS